MKEFDEMLKEDIEKRGNITKEGIEIKGVKETVKLPFSKKNDLENLHRIDKEKLYIEDTKRLDIVLATALSNRLEGIPIWLILVGASGDMKSVQLNALMGEESYVLHNLTSKTLVNGYKNKKEHPDLAPKINGKVVIVPDMAQILKLPPAEKAELWGQLRDLYDGFAGKESGQGSSAKYKGLKITLLAGSTPAIDGQILVHQDLGTRELIYRTSGNKNKEKVMEKCFENEENEKEIAGELKKVTSEFLGDIKISRNYISKEILDKLKGLATYISYMRATADFDQYANELRNDVFPEEPTRIAKQLKRLFICLTSLAEDYPEERALEILNILAKSSSFRNRVNVLNFLLKCHEEVSTSGISEVLKVGKSTVKRECSVMENLGILNCRKQETTYPDKFYEFWKINKENKFVKTLKESTNI